MKTLTKVFLQGLIFCSTLLVIANAHAEKNFKGLHESIPEHHSVKKFAIRFDFDGDGCLPAPAVSRKGKKNEGLKTSGSQTGGCRETFQFDNANTYHRRLCIEKDKKNNYCVHMYALYFEKDQIALGPLAHRHDWEYGLVWTKNGKLTHASYSAHGDVETDSLDELKYKIEDKTHVKLVYHLDDGGFNSHAMRFAKAHERAENPKKKFVTPTLVDWYEMKGDGDYL
ncbi:MAG: NPP1 family protein, partial [Gammaproteobacteria bacterium]|nr:NPP1 family protein [Gammaproteobacteria bacterium]